MTRPRRVVLCPDKFKGSLTAPEVAEAIRRGILAVHPGVDVLPMPVADGGEGTLGVAIAAGYQRIPVRAAGPTGALVETAYAIREGTAVIELADSSGLARLPGGRLRPMTAFSRGAGEVMAGALDAGCSRVVLAIGGSASTDGGAGLIAALGARLLDRNGQEIGNGGAALVDVASIDLGGLHPRLRTTELVVASDVDSPLTGPRGAAAVYAPQKGATADDVAKLERALSRWADVVDHATASDLRHIAGAGAAGGVGYAALALLGAQVRPGIELVLDLIDFQHHVAGADLVVTGEGSLDSQSLHGKAPIGVARAALAAGVPTVAVCGRRLIDDHALRMAGIEAAYALTDLEPNEHRCMSEASNLLEQLGRRLACDQRVAPR